MKRKSSTRGGGGGGGGGGGEEEKCDGGKNKKHSSSRSSKDGNTTSKKKKTDPPPPPMIGTVATRTRHHTKAIASTWKHPISILIHIMGYADPDTMRKLCCVSKQFYDIIANNPGMEQNRVVPLLEISPAKDQDDAGRITRLLRFLQHRSRDKLQRYRELKMIDANKFAALTRIPGRWNLDTLRLYGVVSLDISSPPPNTVIGDTIDLYYFLSSILPNLRVINLSNNGCGSLYTFSKNCPNLEKITWHNIDRKQSAISIDGYDMGRAANLKQIYMDDSVFWLDHADERHQLSDLENDEHSNIFLFNQCRTKLERVSIRNAKWYGYGCPEDTVIPQKALIKFVRNALTSLRWFRSDLTVKNMTMLRSERPGIELVN